MAGVLSSNPVILSKIEYIQEHSLVPDTERTPQLVIPFVELEFKFSHLSCHRERRTATERVMLS